MLIGTPAFGSAAIGIACAVLGLCLTSAPHAARRVIPFSGGLLMGIAAFGVLPELAADHRWAGALVLLAAGAGILWAVGRYVYPVCPACSHTHEHTLCTSALHGFATPLVLAASVHSFLDGLGIAASRQERSEGLAAAVLLGIVLHKVPEGIALGVMLRAALPSRAAALAWCVVAEGATVPGAYLESVLNPWLGLSWVSYALALTGGSFLYLGFHAVHGEWRRRGPLPAFGPALTGAVGAAALQQGLRLLLR
ncbi:MAG: ZIP family metal transporter [Acidobacteriota bacterium]